MKDVMDNMVKLKNGREVVIRSLRADDLDRSMSFLGSLPEEDRNYLRGDVTQKKVVERRIRSMERGKVRRLVAEDNGRIVAEGAMELADHGWAQHIGELRLIVGRDYQKQGLGTLMAKELYGIAAEEKVEEILVRMMKPQTGAQRIFKRLGFHDACELAEAVKDMKGEKQDLVVMRCSLKDLWQELEEYLHETDWERRR